MELKRGNLYWDKKASEIVEFGYIGKTGLAIVCTPGDSGGGTWAINLERLEHISKKDKCLGRNGRDNKKYYLTEFPEDGNNGWIFTRTNKGKYLIHSLFNADISRHPFWTRKQLKEKRYDFDSFTKPEGHLKEISKEEAERIIIKWKNFSKKLPEPPKNNIYNDNIGDYCEDKKINDVARNCLNYAQHLGFKFLYDYDNYSVNKKGYFITIEEAQSGGSKDSDVYTDSEDLQYILIRIEKR